MGLFFISMADSVETILARIEERLNAALSKQEGQHERLNDHGKRIGALERWQSRVLGAVAVSMAVLGYVLKKFGWS